MNKGFYTDILKNNEKLFSAIIAFNIQNFQSITSHALLQESDNKLFTYINKEFLTNYLQKKYIKNTTDFFYWNFTDETKRLLLVDIESLYQLALLIGISLHANEISLKIKKKKFFFSKNFLEQIIIFMLFLVQNSNFILFAKYTKTKIMNYLYPLKFFNMDKMLFITAQHHGNKH